MSQHKRHSLLESITNTVVGFGINVMAQHLIFPLFGIFIGWSENLTIAMFFTVISIIRGYVLRRVFNFYT